MDKPLQLHHTDWALLLLLLATVAAGYLRWTYPRKFAAFTSVPFERKYLTQFAQNDSFSVLANWMFYLVFPLAITLAWVANEGRHLLFTDWKEYLRFFFISAIVFTFQNLINALIGGVFEISKEVTQQIQIKSATRHWGFLLLTPLLFVLLFLPQTPLWAMVIPLLVFVGFYLVGTVRALRAIRPSGPLSTSYIFLYFCTLEILPLILLFRAVRF